MKEKNEEKSCSTDGGDITQRKEGLLGACFWTRRKNFFVEAKE